MFDDDTRIKFWLFILQFGIIWCDDKMESYNFN